MNNFIEIPAGVFQMGSPETEAGRYADEACREVEITRGFWLADAPVTVSEWEGLMGDNPCLWSGDQPVTNVSWNDVQAFIAALNRREPGMGYRLPTEAEWEYACRAGTTTARYWGEDISPEHACYGRDGPTAVRSYPPNPWGLYDMLGLVWEWCEERYPKTTEVRGGSWFSDGRLVRSAQRLAIPPSSRYRYFGFRLARGETSSSTEGEGRVTRGHEHADQ